MIFWGVSGVSGLSMFARLSFAGIMNNGAKIAHIFRLTKFFAQNLRIASQTT
jgi:hypothetical protein